MIEIFDCEQNSPEWYQCRSGLVTASSLSKVLAKGQGKIREAYAKQIACERFTGLPTEGWGGNEYTKRGHEQEPEAQAEYTIITGNQLTACGFMVNHRDIGGVGYSPDGLTAHGLFEGKTRKSELHFDLLKSGEVPSEHRAQIQCGLWVSERDSLDFMCYSRGMPSFIKTVYRDDEFIENARLEVIKFYALVEECIDFLIRYQIA